MFTQFRLLAMLATSALLFTACGNSTNFNHTSATGSGSDSLVTLKHRPAPSPSASPTPSSTPSRSPSPSPTQSASVQVSIATPTNNQVFGSGVTVDIQSAATSSSGSISQVQYVVNGTTACTDTSANFYDGFYHCYFWVGTSPQGFTAVVTATDVAGHSGSTSVIFYAISGGSSPSPSPSPSASATPSPSPSASPSSSPSTSPTFTPSPSATPSPSPTQTSAPGTYWSGLLKPTFGSGACNYGSVNSAGECAIDWTTSGVIGGIPARSTICSTAACNTVTANGPASTAAQIQAALNSCPAGQAVLLPPGNYTLNADLSIPSNVTLRGSGTQQTILTYTGTTGFPIYMGSHAGGDTPNASNAVAITAGAAAGSSSIVVANSANMQVGGLLVVTELNDPTYVSISTPNGNCTWCDAYLFHNSGTRVRGQTVKITSVNGTTIGITPPLYTSYGVAPGTSPAMASPYGSVSGSLPDVVMAGVENLQLYMTNSSPNSSVNGANISMRSCDECWVSGVYNNYSDSDQVDVDYCYHCQVQNSYFSNSFIHSSGGSDAELRVGSYSSGVLVQNNILERLHSSIILEWGSAGNVIAYNYTCCSYDSVATNVLNEDVAFHGAHPQFNLFEGNVVDDLNLDAFWGSSSNTTAFRNLARGASTIAPYASSGAYTGRAGQGGNGAINWAGAHVANQQNRSYTITFEHTGFNSIGNIAGSADAESAVGGASNLFMGGIAPYLMNAIPSMSRDYNGMFYAFNYGYNTGADSDGSAVASFAGGPSNANGYWVGLANASKFQHGNWDMASNSTVWMAGVTESLPASFYLSGKPSWWSGSIPYPAIGPDVSGGNVDSTVLAGHVYANPAQSCYLKTAKDANGMLKFDPANCY